jgi:hypothetical protein
MTLTGETRITWKKSLFRPHQNPTLTGLGSKLRLRSTKPVMSQPQNKAHLLCSDIIGNKQKNDVGMWITS